MIHNVHSYSLREISAEIINSQLYIFEESNHFPYLEEKEKFFEMVSDFNRLDQSNVI